MQFAECAELYGKASTIVPDADAIYLPRFVEVGKTFLKECALKLAREASGPVLFEYQADGTRVDAQCYQGYVAGKKRHRRSGGHATETYVERGLVVAFASDGTLRCAPVFRDPRVMEKKHGWAWWAAAHEFFPLLKQLREGICLTHYFFDGGTFSFLSRLCQQRHALFHEAVGGKRPGLANTDIVVCSSCALHVAGNSIHWGLMRYVVGEDKAKFLKHVHIVIASVRKSNTLLVQNMPELLKRVRWEGETYDKEVDTQLWIFLGHDAELAEDLAMLQLEWRSGLIFCNREFQHKYAEDLAERLSGIFLATWEFRNFCETRWGTVGPCLRSFVSALLLGLPHYIEIIVSKGASLFYLNGFPRLDENIRPQHIIVL